MFSNFLRVQNRYSYSAYHQIVTIKISKNSNYLEEFSSLAVFLVDNFRKCLKNRKT